MSSVCPPTKLRPADSSWVYEINVYDLKRRVWISRTEQPEAQGLHSKGAYRSVATSSKQRVILPKNALSYAINEEGEGGGQSFVHYTVEYR